MTYDPSVDTIRKRILDNVQEALESIAGPPTYAHRVAMVRQFLGNAMEFPNYPAIAIVPRATRSDDSRLALIEHVVPMTLLLMVRSSTWRDDIQSFLADCRVALLADHTRGGVALTTRATVEEIQDSELSSPLGGAEMEIEVLYRTLYHDPGSAI